MKSQKGKKEYHSSLTNLRHCDGEIWKNNIKFMLKLMDYTK